LHPEAIEGLRLFAAGKHFKAHEALEAAWKAERSPVRDLYRGILGAAVTYLLITRGNYAGALKLYERTQRWLKPWPEVCRGIQVGRLRRDLETVIHEMQRLGRERIAEFDRSHLKPAHWH
jgi:predicted metal-dependent hydrolase